jgi:hypothetical protein
MIRGRTTQIPLKFIIKLEEESILEMAVLQSEICHPVPFGSKNINLEIF